ncbi:hypothetical protein BURPS1106B_1446 [Burkholderia pseudomallei 1106b]|uniref:Uncharacterized protein n=1 Tax=Burkholderia pseudomallei (strain 1106a) TaxID=357348 RepID=A3P2M8_BURP0|nr:hypothetical protein BURPS1106A_A0552 [Burkholderia pseudomallei 1106a]EES22985.1 hypothetical protein BURPS1106B_1446 [Burkholderia pseudomallei 1106b]
MSRSAASPALRPYILLLWNKYVRVKEPQFVREPGLTQWPSDSDQHPVI